MTGNELLEYIEENGLEYQAINMAMFNEIGFCFIPIKYPIIVKMGYLMSFRGGKNGYDLLSAREHPYAVFSPEMLDEEDYDEDYEKFIALLNRMCLHPEHLYGYTARYKEHVWANYVYNKKSKGVTGIEEIRNLIILDFIEYASIKSIIELHKYIDRSFIIRSKKYAVNDIHFSKDILENGADGMTAPILFLMKSLLTL